MFGILKNISTFTKREINGLAIVLNLLYFALMVVIPTIIVCSQYNLFYKAETMTKLTGVGIIVVVILGIYLLTKRSRFRRKGEYPPGGHHCKLRH